MEDTNLAHMNPWERETREVIVNRFRITHSPLGGTFRQIDPITGDLPAALQGNWSDLVEAKRQIEDFLSRGGV